MNVPSDPIRPSEADSGGAIPTPQPDSAPASPGSGPGALTSEMEAEIDAAMASLEAEDAGSSAPVGSGGSPGGSAKHAEVHGAKPAIRGPRVVQGGREHRKGRIVSVGPEDIFLEFGPKELGVLSRAQIKEENLPTVDQELEVVIERFSTEEQLFMCVLPGTVQKADWELLEVGQIVEAVVTGTNKGGLELETANHRAFMPASQVDVHRIEDLTPFVGQKLACEVIRVDRMGKGNITLSRRKIVARERKEQTAQLKESLKEGELREGVVRKIMPFGAFVDIGGVDGLLHVSDLSHDRVAKVEDVLKEGDKVQVKILKLDWETGRHSLGLKQLQADPWEASLGEINEGDVVPGRITKLLEFGAFVEIAPGIEGLVHISELSWNRVAKVSDAVQPNASVSVKVLRIDRDARKIGLSIKQTKDRPAAPGGPKRGGRRGEQDTRTPDEILKETPALRRMREKAKQRESASGGGLGSGLGIGLGDLKL